MKVKVHKYTGNYGGYKFSLPLWKQKDFDDTLKNPAYFHQFEEKYGFNPAAVWNLDEAIARFVLPRLTYYKDIHTGYPTDCTFEKFEEYLDKMIYSFKCIAYRQHYLMPVEKQKEIQEGLNLFGKYFMSLWD